jgi:hypothetical protein
MMLMLMLSLKYYKNSVRSNVVEPGGLRRGCNWFRLHCPVCLGLAPGSHVLVRVQHRGGESGLLEAAQSAPAAVP